MVISFGIEVVNYTKEDEKVDDHLDTTIDMKLKFQPVI